MSCEWWQVTGTETTLVHYAQQQARREAESSAIRRQKNELEVALRDAEIRYALQTDKSNQSRLWQSDPSVYIV